jgi:MFS family permease
LSDQLDHSGQSGEFDRSGAGAAARGLTYLDVLRVPHVGRLIGSAALSRLAGQMFGLALVLHVLAEFRSPPLAGVTVFASFAPGLLVSPIAGAVLDRFGAARGIVADLLASAAVVAALALVASPGTAGGAGGGDGPGDAVAVLLVLLAVLYSLTSPLNIAGVRTLLPRLVPVRGVERANALDIGSYSLAEVLGPAGAGLLFAAIGGRATLLVIAVMYGLSWLLLARLPARTGRTRSRAERAASRSREGGEGLARALLREAVAGVRYVLRHPVLRALLISYSLYQFAWGVLVVAVPTVVAGTGTGAARGQGTVGLLWAVAGLAGVIGALVAGRVCTAGRERAAIVIGTLVTGAAAAPVMAAGGTAGIVGGLVAVGLASGMVDVGLLTLRQRRTDPGWLGRVLAVSISLNLAGLPIGSAAGGYLVAHSPALAFTVAGGAAGLGALAAALMIPGPASERAAPG